MVRKVNDAPLKIHRTTKPDANAHHAQTLLSSLLQQLPNHCANRRKASLRSRFPLRLLASQAHDLPYVNIGTGIGGGIISGGQLVRGWRNLAGEIGHMTVKPDGPLCPCGRKGCLEALASGDAIGREGSERIGQPLTSEEVFMLAERGNPIAKRVIDDAVEALAFAIGAAANLLNPKRVILGGGVAEAPEALLLQPLRERLHHYLLPQVAEDLEVVRAQLGYDAGIFGAIALALTDVEAVKGGRDDGD